MPRVSEDSDRGAVGVSLVVGVLLVCIVVGVLLVYIVSTLVAMFYRVPKDADVPHCFLVVLFDMLSPTTSGFCHQRHTPSTKMVVDVLGGVCGFFIDARFHHCRVRVVAVVVSHAVGVHCLAAIAVLSWCGIYIHDHVEQMDKHWQRGAARTAATAARTAAATRGATGRHANTARQPAAS